MPAETPATDAEWLFDLSLDLLCVIRDGRITRASRSWTTVLGWTEDELRGMPIMDLVHPDDRSATRPSLGHDGTVRQFVNRYRCRDGSYRMLEWSARRDSTTGTVLGVARDITDARAWDRSARALDAAWAAVASRASPEDLQRVIAAAARELIGAEQATSSMTIGPDGAQEVAGVDLSDAYAAWRDYDAPPDGSGIYRLVALAGEPMRLTQQELLAHPAWRGFGDQAASHPPMRGWLAVPLLGSEGRVLGLIQLSDKSDGGDFDELDELLLVQFARLAALALERAVAEVTAQDANLRADSVLDSISDGCLSLRSDGRLDYVNSAAAAALGAPRHELLGQTLWDLMPEDEPALRRWVDELLAAPEPVSAVQRIPGTPGWYDVRAYPHHGGVAVYFLDVTERIAVAEEMQLRAAQQKVVADIGHAALSGLSLEALADLAAAEVGGVLGARHVLVLQLTEDRTGLLRVSHLGRDGDSAPLELPLYPGGGFEEALATGSLAIVEDYRKHPAPSASIMVERGTLSSASVPIGRPGQPWGVLSASSDVVGAFGPAEGLFLRQVAHVLSTAIERQASEAQVRHQATHDVLTALPNRAVLRERLDAAVESAIAHGTRTGLLLLDLDGFKDVNDSLGHAAGDVVLEMTAARLREAVGERGLVARLGGDEFGICLDDPLAPEDLLAIGHRVVAVLRRPFELPEFSVTLSASVGAVLAPDHGAEASMLLRHADVAMYRAKASGTGVEVYDPARDSARTERLTAIAELREGVRRREFVVFYQPVVDLCTGRPMGLEALVRWAHPSRGLLAPGEFIELAEQTGLIAGLTRLVIEQTVDQVRHWRKDGLSTRVAVNLSVAALRDPAVASGVIDALVAGAEELAVEVTESAVVDAHARQALQALAGVGIKCAIDDFGTGYSSMASLRDLPVRLLKIDRTFVTQIAANDRDLAIVRGIVDLANALSLSVIAEGVETAEAAERLLGVGVPMAQGYYYARPLPAESLAAWWAAAVSAAPAAT